MASAAGSVAVSAATSVMASAAGSVAVSAATSAMASAAGSVAVSAATSAMASAADSAVVSVRITAVSTNGVHTTRATTDKNGTDTHDPAASGVVCYIERNRAKRTLKIEEE